MDWIQNNEIISIFIVCNETLNKFSSFTLVFRIAPSKKKREKAYKINSR